MSWGRGAGITCFLLLPHQFYFLFSPIGLITGRSSSPSALSLVGLTLSVVRNRDTRYLLSVPAHPFRARRKQLYPELSSSSVPLPGKHSDTEFLGLSVRFGMSRNKYAQYKNTGLAAVAG